MRGIAFAGGDKSPSLRQHSPQACPELVPGAFFQHWLPIRKTTTMPQKRIRGKKTTWIARYRDNAGKEHSKSFPTRREAAAFEEEQRRALRRQEWVDPAHSTMTVRELMQGWMDSLVIRKTSHSKYKHTLANLGPLADAPAGKLTTGEVNAWYRTLVQGRPWVEGKPLSEVTASAMMRHLGSAYQWGMKEGLLVKSPVVMPKRSASDAIMPEDIPTREEIQAVITCVREGGARYRRRKERGKPIETFTQGSYPVVADMLEIAAATGMRVSEITGLQVGDIDLVGGVVKVRAQLGAGGKRVELKTARSRRDIPIGAAASVVLQMAMIGRGADDFLFTQESGAPWALARLSVIVKRAREHVGAPSVHFHALRHFFASSLLSAGVPVHEVASVLGHSSQMLLSTYAHVLPGAGDRARGVIDGVWCGTNAGQVATEGEEKQRLRW